jgi:hypothetical protein
MEQWKDAIAKGSMDFNEGHDDAAMAALVISYQNIADVYFRKHDYPHAINNYQDLYQ